MAPEVMCRNNHSYESDYYALGGSTHCEKIFNIFSGFSTFDGNKQGSFATSA